VSPFYGRPYGIIDTFFRGAYNFDYPIGMAMLYRTAGQLSLCGNRCAYISNRHGYSPVHGLMRGWPVTSKHG
jgi:hypothetical protein